MTYTFHVALVSWVEGLPGGIVLFLVDTATLSHRDTTIAAEYKALITDAAFSAVCGARQGGIEALAGLLTTLGTQFVVAIPGTDVLWKGRVKHHISNNRYFASCDSKVRVIH